MKLENRTAYETRVLRRIIAVVHLDLARREGRRLPQWDRLRVVVRHSRRGGVTGCAWLGGSPVVLRLPPAGRALVADVVLLVAHELLHSYGYRHAQFTDPFRVPEEWAGTLAALALPERLAIRAPAIPRVRDVRAERYARVLELEKAWTRKAKLAQTKLRGLRARRQYYERAAPAAG